MSKCKAVLNSERVKKIEVMRKSKEVKKPEKRNRSIRHPTS